MASYSLPESGAVAREITTLETRFNRFHEYRGVDGWWNKLVKRELEEPVAAHLAANVDGIDFQSPASAKAIQDHVAVLMLNEPQFDDYVAGESQRSRDLERDQLLVKSTWFRTEINKARLWEARVKEGQTRHGIKVEWLRPKALKPNYDAGELNPRMGCPNYFDNTLLDGNYWTDEDPEGADAHYYRYSLPVYGCKLKNKEGQKVTLDAVGNIGWIGEHEDYDIPTIQNKEVDIIVRDARDLSGAMCPLEGCDHVRRMITVYVCPHGADFTTRAEEVETYPSPFPGNSFFIIGATMFQTERDPDRVFRPSLMESLYSLLPQLNSLVKHHMVLTLQESSDLQLYANASQSRPENVQTLLMKEGGTADSVALPQPGINEVPVYPFTLDRLPKKTSAEVMQLIRLMLELIQEAMPNRFQMGVNYTEASNATASANTAALQQSALPYHPPLMQMAMAIDKWNRYTDHQIRWNAYFEPDDAQTRYYAVVSGDENLMRYGATAKRGEEVYLDAKKCATPHDFVVKIENLTWVEKQTKWYLSYSQYQAGVKTVEDLIRDSGIADVQAQMRLLYRGQVRQSLQPLLIRMYDLLMTREASVNTGFDFGQLLQQVVPQQGMIEPPGTNEGNPQNTMAANVARSSVQLPALNGPNGSSGGGP